MFTLLWMLSFAHSSTTVTDSIPRAFSMKAKFLPLLLLRHEDCSLISRKVLAWIIISLFRFQRWPQKNCPTSPLSIRVASTRRRILIESEFMIIPEWPSISRTDPLIDILVPSLHSSFLGLMELLFWKHQLFGAENQSPGLIKSIYYIIAISILCEPEQRSVEIYVISEELGQELWGLIFWWFHYLPPFTKRPRP